MQRTEKICLYDFCLFSFFNISECTETPRMIRKAKNVGNYPLELFRGTKQEEKSPKSCTYYLKGREYIILYRSFVFKNLLTLLIVTDLHSSLFAMAKSKVGNYFVFNKLFSNFGNYLVLNKLIFFDLLIHKLTFWETTFLRFQNLDKKEVRKETKDRF